MLQPLPFGGSPSVSSWLGTYFAALVGAVCVVAGTWLARGINAGDLALVRNLLGPTSMAERVSELERTRTLAVEDSAAALRRVERDLHDGAQMRLAALAMNLGMAREKLDDQDDATVRELIDAAHRNAVDTPGRPARPGPRHPPAGARQRPGQRAGQPGRQQRHPGVGRRRDRPAAGPGDRDHRVLLRGRVIANATKHSYANQITIELAERAEVLRLEVSDDGVGGADATRGSGLAGLVQRVPRSTGGSTCPARPAALPW